MTSQFFHLLYKNWQHNLICKFFFLVPTDPMNSALRTSELIKINYFVYKNIITPPYLTHPDPEIIVWCAPNLVNLVYIPAHAANHWCVGQSKHLGWSTLGRSAQLAPSIFFRLLWHSWPLNAYLLWSKLHSAFLQVLQKHFKKLWCKVTVFFNMWHSLTILIYGTSIRKRNWYLHSTFL